MILTCCPSTIFSTVNTPKPTISVKKCIDGYSIPGLTDGAIYYLITDETRPGLIRLASSREDARDIQAYVMAQALREPTLVERAAEWLTSRGVCVPGAWLAD